ncbi:MAG TPA: Ig-like domain-containing protein, partial [bacterium]
MNDPPDITSPLTVAATEHQAFTYLASATDPDNAVLTFTFKNRPAWLASNKDTLKGIPPEGTSNFTFDLVVSDGSLKDSVRVTVTVTPVNDPPVFTSASQIYATEDVEFAYTAQATDPEGAGITYQFRNQPFWMTVTSISTIRGTATEGILQGGFDVIANDGVKTTTLHVTVHINPVEDPPIITSPDTALAVEHQAFSYTAEGFDPEGKTVNYTFSSYPAWLTPKTGNRIEGTPGEGITEGAFDLTANDGVLSFTKRVRIRVTPVNDSPAIQSPSTASGTEGVMFTYTTQASDPEGQPLTYTFQNVPNWLRTAGQTVSGTPKNGTLTGTFTFTVSDGVLTKSQTVTITIQPVNDAPVITSPSQINATEHIEFTYTAAAYDSEGDPLTYSFQNMSSWLVVSGTTLRGKPEEGITDGSFDIVVSDGQLSSTKHVVIQLTHVNDPPVFTSSNTASGTEDIPFSYTAAATDPENGQVTYGFQNLPTWLAANGSTVSGTPGEKVLSASFDVTASDGVLSSSLHVTVTVTAVNDPPVITSVNQVAATEHQPFKYTPTAT